MLGNGAIYVRLYSVIEHSVRRIFVDEFLAEWRSGLIFSIVLYYGLEFAQTWEVILFCLLYNFLQTSSLVFY